MIQISDKPALNSFSGNPIRYEVLSGSLLSSVGSKAQMILKFTAMEVVTGHHFCLTVNNEVLTFNQIMFPDDSGLSIPLINNNLAEYVFAICECLKLNYTLRSNYDFILGDITTGERRITIIAKEKGSKWTLAFGNNTVSGLTMDLNQGGTDEIERDNFGIVCSVWIDQTVNIQGGNAPHPTGVIQPQLHKIAEDLKSVDSDGKAIFDISEYLRSFIKTNLEGPQLFTYPEVATQNLAVWKNLVLPYYVSFAERYSNATRMLVFDTIRYAIAGGLSRELLCVYNDQAADYFSLSDNLKRFLTWAPVVKTTGKTQMEKLSFFLCGDNHPYSYRLAIRVKFSDGSYFSYYGSDSDSCSTPTLLEIMVGYDHLGLSSLDVTRDVESWEVWLEDRLGGVISEVRKFILDTDVYEHERTFLLRNSFGRYDTIRFLGTGETTMAYERNAGEVVSDEVITSINPPSKNFETWETQSFKADSGFVSQQMRDYLRELLITNEAYEVVQGLLFPIVLKSVKISPFATDGVYLYNLQVEYDRAYNDQYYSGQFKPINMINNDDLTQGVGVIYEYSDDTTYFGYPQNGTSSETEDTWRIKRIQKTVVNGKTKHIVKWADGNLNYDNQMSNCENLVYAFLNS